ncbi:MAG TPA: RNA pyrophosphohydrolase [Rhodobacteraceae bacterium]|nr:RNA pyrophosphohydrolase [Paracoccaceae bacterium]
MTDEEFLALPYRPNAGVMLLNDVGKVFVGKRIDTDGEAWQMPQGGIDKGEDAEAASLRELTEETGIPARLVSIISVSESWIKYDFPRELAAKLWVRRSGEPRYRGQKQRWFLMRFKGQDSDVNIATSHPEFSDWKWMKPADLPHFIVPFKQDIYRQVLKEFSGWI